MGSIWGLGAALLAIVAVMQLVMLIIITSRLVKMPLWAPLLIPTSRSAVEDVVPVLDTVREELERNGFRYMHTRRVRSIISASGIPYGFCDVYYHLEHDIHAEVCLAAPPTRERLCDIYLWNTFTDGTALLTVNQLTHALIPYPSTVRIADGHAADLADQMATHLQARESIAMPRTDAADALSIAKTMSEQLLPRMEEEGLVYRRGQRGGDVVYGFRFLPAVQAAWRMRRAALRPKKKSAAGAATNAVAPDFGAARPIAERLAFARTLCMLRGMRAPRWFRRTVFALSAAAFLALGSWWWGFAGAMVVALVILVHEAGHWLAMKLAGFRDVQVFFVPGMGGATSGERHEAPPMTHLVVYLAGPVPGLLLSLAVFAWAAFHPAQAGAAWYPTLLAAAVAAFFINALNMLPVLPLDGGRVIELLLVERLPWLQFIFALASGGVLLLAGMALGDNVMRAIGIVMLIGSQQHYRIAKASAQLLREKKAASADIGFPQAARQLYDFLDRPVFQKWGFQTKMNVGMALLPRYLRRTPSWKETASAMAVYIACALLPLAVLIGLVVASPGAMMDAIGQGVFLAPPGTGATGQAPQDRRLEPPVDEDSRLAMQKAARKRREITLAAVQEPAQRQQAIQEAIRDAHENDDLDDALRLARLGYAEAGTLTAPARERAQAALTLIGAIANKNESLAGPEIEALQREAESVLRQRIAARNEKADRLLLAQVLQAHSTPAADQAALLATLQEIAALYASGLDEPDYRLVNAQRNLARVQDRSGQTEAAEQTLRLATANFAKTPNGQDDQQSLTNDLAWMLVAHHKLDEAALLVAPMTTAPADDAPNSTLNQRQARMVLLTVLRLKGDWAGASQQAQALLDADTAASRAPIGGNWFVNLLLSRMPPPLDWRATLLLIDSERKQGHNAAADRLLADLRESRKSAASASPVRNICRARVVDALWRREWQQALLDIEQRELQCTVADQVTGRAVQSD